MSKFTYQILYQIGSNVFWPNDQCRYSLKDNYIIKRQFFNKGILLDLEEDNVGEKEHAKHMELGGIDVGT